VTGGSAGIGRAACLRFAEAGAKVVLAARRAEQGEQTAELVRAAGGEALFVRADVSRPAEVEALAERCVQTYGRLDYAFNNAGIENPLTLLVDLNENSWDAVIDTNLKGVWLSMKAEIPRIIAAGGGAIVNMASVGGLLGFPGMGPYCASKHGVIGLTKTAALEYAPQKLRVNVVCPSLIDTAMADRFTGGPGSSIEEFVMSRTPLHRRGTPAEVAEAVVWLCSDAASFVNGHSLVIDGGLMSS
jgi:NAD(P)-dependent dehydrogenase (short-subunit alcohol dehydrogenase family)